MFARPQGWTSLRIFKDFSRAPKTHRDNEDERLINALSAVSRKVVSNRNFIVSNRTVLINTRELCSFLFFRNLNSIVEFRMGRSRARCVAMFIRLLTIFTRSFGVVLNYVSSNFSSFLSSNAR